MNELMHSDYYAGENAAKKGNLSTKGTPQPCPPAAACLLLCSAALPTRTRRSRNAAVCAGWCAGNGQTAPDPAGNITLPNGCVVPSGKGAPTKISSSLLYNEFIVYDVQQIRIKYLLKYKHTHAHTLSGTQQAVSVLHVLTHCALAFLRALTYRVRFNYSQRW